MTKTIAVIGGGPAGMEAAASLASKGYSVYLFEENEILGGHLNCWDRLFPTKRPGEEVLEYLQQGISAGIEVVYEAIITKIEKENSAYRIFLANGKDYLVNAVLLATGFVVFDATRKEEYGYGIYENVITSVELENVFREKKELRTSGGKVPQKIGIIHCVGSRDEKAGNIHCSKVCCVTGIKQAIELKEMIPGVQVFCFYMDLRMYGLGYEELYKESQEQWSVQYIRGRLSESFENQDGTIMIKVEDTLSGLPLRMNLDLLVLLVGFLPSAGTTSLGKMLQLDFNPNGFLQPKDGHTLIHDTVRPGVFLAGSCKGPKNVEETLADARSSVIRIEQYFAENRE